MEIRLLMEHSMDARELNWFCPALSMYKITSKAGVLGTKHR